MGLYYLYGKLQIAAIPHYLRYNVACNIAMETHFQFTLLTIGFDIDDIPFLCAREEKFIKLAGPLEKLAKK